jgi:hypothetical protein
MYEGSACVDGDFDAFALVAPDDPGQRAKWGWKQDERGRGYRDIEEGKSVAEPPGVQAASPPAPTEATPPG